MDFVINLICLVVGFGLGTMYYRWQLKRDPAKLDRWSAEIKAARQRVRDRMDNLND
jgi:hypothetical protein